VFFGGSGIMSGSGMESGSGWVGITPFDAADQGGSNGTKLRVAVAILWLF
jgi:hypothetical protein